MPTRMLIDASHSEETRVAVIRGNRIEEFDFEAANKKQLRGNIYLARVTRVEPSLQAAFVEYGGNRHGFLAFSEIHPDYYQIPIEDREALIAEEAQSRASSDDDDEEEPTTEASGDDEDAPGPEVEEVGADDTLGDAEAARNVPSSRRYKIQEVIKRRQILLIQVVKEERGNKGAALTTYLSLAGRHCVLMPNTARGGGVSRKIGNYSDRKRLKKILNDLEVPEGMGCIIRTAGANRTKAEIKRDYTYLLRQWDSIRELTLSSTAPILIHEEGDLIRRSMRDVYSSEIDEVLVEGANGYRVAKDFMKIMMPSHARKVQQYKEDIPLFHRYQVESQLESMFSTTVTLKSGGYLVINPTEALISIDVNSGKATKERNIEKTAHKTNLEAAEEVARQLRLRDLAGLIVIDFIDMDEPRHNRAVERKMKECLKTDRARLQVGRISAFGLMEMSRQRTRPGMLEVSSHTCPMCEGTGLVRNVESSALQVLRAIEGEGIHSRGRKLHVAIPADVALYILNHKRRELGDIEDRYEIQVDMEGDASMHRPHYEIRREGSAGQQDEDQNNRRRNDRRDKSGDDEQKGNRRNRRNRRNRDDDNSETSETNMPESDTEDGPEEGRKRRRRGKRGGRRRRRGQGDAENTVQTTTEESTSSDAPSEEQSAKDSDQPEIAADAAVLDISADPSIDSENAEQEASAPSEEQAEQPAEEEAPKKPRRRRSRCKPKAEEASDTTEAAESADTPAEEAAATSAEEPPTAEESASDSVEGAAPAEEPAEPAPAVAEAPVEDAPAEPATVEAEAEPEPQPEPEPERPKGPTRTGWWNRGPE